MQPLAFTFFLSSVFQSWAVWSLCVSSLLLHHEHNKVTHWERKFQLLLSCQNCLRLEGCQEVSRTELFSCSCQTGLNTVFSVVTQRHTITIIDIQLCTLLYIFSWSAAVGSCSSVMVHLHPVQLRMGYVSETFVDRVFKSCYNENNKCYASP